MVFNFLYLYISFLATIFFFISYFRYCFLNFNLIYPTIILIESTVETWIHIHYFTVFFFIFIFLFLLYYFINLLY